MTTMMSSLSTETLFLRLELVSRVCWLASSYTPLRSEPEQQDLLTSENRIILNRHRVSGRIK
eukprot:scaffold43567_cov59-Attheya_sp.AAC.1